MGKGLRKGMSCKSSSWLTLVSVLSSLWTSLCWLLLITRAAEFAYIFHAGLRPLAPRGTQASIIRSSVTSNCSLESHRPSFQDWIFERAGSLPKLYQHSRKIINDIPDPVLRSFSPTRSVLPPSTPFPVCPSIPEEAYLGFTLPWKFTSSYRVFWHLAPNAVRRPVKTARQCTVNSVLYTCWMLSCSW